MLLNKLVFEHRYSPILAIYIDIEGAASRKLRLKLRTAEGRTTLYNEGIGISVSMPSMLRAPMDALEAGFVKTVVRGLSYFLRDSRDSRAILIIDELGEHRDPVLVQKLLDHVVKTII